jgi:RNA polymerase sigma factor (sigma-70 family)
VTDAHRAIDAVWRIESARLIAGLTRFVGDVSLAEELAQDALVAALEQWPREGVPRNPAAWLMQAAKRRAIDHHRRARRTDETHATLGRALDDDNRSPEDALAESLDDEVGDDLLRLVFMCCHPVLPLDARVALTLRLLGGLTTDEIARAYLAHEATIAQRIVRAKRALAAAKVPYEVPRGDDLRERLAGVLRVIYLVFNEGYSPSTGDAWVRPALLDEALRLGRVLQGLMPGESEVHGLAALMELQASRAEARVNGDGAPVLLLEQDRRRWDRLLISRGLAALARAERLAERLADRPGPYTLQASIAACHARALVPFETDWARIVSLYDQLLDQVPTPVVALNRAVAIGMSRGPESGLAAVDALRDDPVLAAYHLLPSVRGEFLERLGRDDEAAGEFERAAALTTNGRERGVLRERARRVLDRHLTESRAPSPLPPPPLP